MIWGGGLLAQWGVLDFAGGTVVHISAGCAALAGVLVLKRRRSHIEQREIPPANIPYVLIGIGGLWFGWFGFNAGSALGANSLSVSAFATTNTAAAAAGFHGIGVIEREAPLLQAVVIIDRRTVEIQGTFLVDHDRRVLDHDHPARAGRPGPKAMLRSRLPPLPAGVPGGRAGRPAARWPVGERRRRA